MLFSFDGREPIIGKDAYVSETAIVIGDVMIDDNCYIGHGAILRGDYGSISIGSGTAVEEGAIVHSPPEHTYAIGRRVTVGHGAILHGTEIGDGAVIGMGAVLSIGSKVGKGSIIAEGCIVRFGQIIQENVVAAGNPAKIIRNVSEKDIALWSWGKELYIDLAKKYLNIGMHRIK
jgi:carbonic anhydrase/acetyltransferase-like protein (isoleucine patch superfamily)